VTLLVTCTPCFCSSQSSGGRCRFSGFEGGYFPASVSFCNCSNVAPALYAAKKGTPLVKGPTQHPSGTRCRFRCQGKTILHGLNVAFGPFARANHIQPKPPLRRSDNRGRKNIRGAPCRSGCYWLLGLAVGDDVAAGAGVMTGVSIKNFQVSPSRTNIDE
jgi:hypothetical protein